MEQKRVLVIDDDLFLLSAIGQTLELNGYQVELQSDSLAALEKLQQGFHCCAVITDIRMPRLNGMELLVEVADLDSELPVIMVTGHGDIAMAVQAMEQGAYGFLEKPVDEAILLNSLRRAVEKRQLVLENRALQKQLEEQGENFFHGMVGGHPLMRQLYRRIEKIAVENDPVLICGATGTGKELVARALHQLGRPEQPFVALNMAALPAEMAEAELLGYARGAFTGAAEERMGKFGYAGKGTLFLDEICSLDLSLQGKLLRVLEERSYTPLGSNDERPFSARVLSASNRDLADEVAAGRFRQDLFYRLDVLTLQLPSLAERRKDIPLLIEFFCQEYSRERDGGVFPFTAEMVAELSGGNWPGNVRELRNRVRRMCVLGNESSEHVGTTAGQTLREFMEEQEKCYILNVLRRYNGKVSAAHKELGLSRKGLYDKVRRYGIDLNRLRVEMNPDD